MRIYGIDGRMHQGTPLQIVREMRDSTPIMRGSPLDEYIKVVIEAVIISHQIVLRVEGENDEAMAASLIEGLIRHNIVTRH